MSNGNLGCAWPVDVRPELEKEREALRSRLGTAEGRMRDIEGMLARRGARRGAERSPTKSERPATARERSPKSIVDYEEEKPPPAYPRRRPATANSPCPQASEPRESRGRRPRVARSSGRPTSARSPSATGHSRAPGTAPPQATTKASDPWARSIPSRSIRPS